MPNHVVNLITIKDAANYPLKTIRDMIVNPAGHIDFNRLDKMPKCLAEFKGDILLVSHIKNVAKNLGIKVPKTKKMDEDHVICNQVLDEMARKEFKSWDWTPELEKQMHIGTRNLKETGYVYWYDWRVDHWGTKWNAYGQPEGGWPEDEDHYRFITIWRHPWSLIEKMSILFPEATFKIQFADTEIGVGCGEYLIKNGKRFEEDILDNWVTAGEKKRTRHRIMAYRIVSGNTALDATLYEDDFGYTERYYDLDDGYVDEDCDEHMLSQAKDHLI